MNDGPSAMPTGFGDHSRPEGPSRHATFVLCLLLSALGSLSPPQLRAQASTGDPLAEFGERMVGTWEAPDSRHVFGWGVGERAVRSTSYALQAGEWVLVSEGMWYWDPGVGAIRGVTVAIGMPVELFDYTSRVTASEVVHDLLLHGEMGGRYVETWRFTPEGYDWVLEQDGERLMGGSFRKAG